MKNDLKIKVLSIEDNIIRFSIPSDGEIKNFKITIENLLISFVNSQMHIQKLNQILKECEISEDE